MGMAVQVSCWIYALRFHLQDIQRSVFGARVLNAAHCYCCCWHPLTNGSASGEEDENFDTGLVVHLDNRWGGIRINQSLSGNWASEDFKFPHGAEWTAKAGLIPQPLWQLRRRYSDKPDFPASGCRQHYSPVQQETSATVAATRKRKGVIKSLMPKHNQHMQFLLNCLTEIHKTHK